MSCRQRKRTFAVVLRGSFNPAIFHPSWFARLEIVPEGEADQAKIELVHRDIAQFSLGGMKLLVTADQFLVSTDFEDLVLPLRDLVLATFSNLCHTPLRAMGVNCSAHYSMESEAEWHSYGHRLVPKENLWEPILHKPGTAKVVVQGERGDEHKGYVQITVEPSKEFPPGLFIGVNDHFALSDIEQIDSAQANEVFRAILTADFEPIRLRFENVFTHLTQDA